MICDYDCIRKWAKILTYACSAGLVGLGIGKFFTPTAIINPIDYIVNIYLIFLGLVFFICECEWEWVLKKFHFLRYFFGKCFFAIFAGLLCFDSRQWYQIVVASFLFGCAMLYLILGISCFSSEREKIAQGNANAPNVVKPA